jgi:hypothetical protein
MISAEETATHIAKIVLYGAEGATAPETLRLQDRRRMKLWKAGV